MIGCFLKFLEKERTPCQLAKSLFRKRFVMVCRFRELKYANIALFAPKLGGIP